MNWEHLKNEVGEWSKYNFGESEEQKENTMLGMIEEVGELSHAVLKTRQGIRGNEQEHREEALDAIADITIYLMDFCYRYDIKLDGIEPEINRDYGLFESIVYLGQYVATQHNCVRRPAVFKESPVRLADGIIALLKHIAEKEYGVDYEKLVEAVWHKVSQRDWKKYPELGEFKPGYYYADENYNIHYISFDIVDKLAGGDAIEYFKIPSVMGWAKVHTPQELADFRKTVEAEHDVPVQS